MRRTLVLGAALGFCLASAAAPAAAQQIRLTISGLALTKTTTPPSDFDAGSAAWGSMSFLVDVRTNGPEKVTTVSVRCATPCPATGTLSLSRVQWRRADLGTWNTLTTSYVDVESRNARRNVLNDPWSNSIYWRYLLDWVATPPAGPSRFNLQFQLTVSAP